MANFSRSLPWRVLIFAVGGWIQFRNSGRRLARNSRKRELALIEQSSLFDREWYLASYPDVAANGIDPALHYLETGWREGRDAGPGFSTSAYLRANADVAASGINPLLHYVEYGHSEGRGAPEHAAPKQRPSGPRQDFGPAAPCASFPLPPEQLIRWARAGRIDAGGSETLQVDDRVIGFFRSEAMKAGVQVAIAALRRFDRGLVSKSLDAQARSRASPAMLDAWYVNRSVLRTRWVGVAPFIVRALQQVAEAPVLIAEAVVSDQLDLIDARLSNPFFPVLFVFTDCDGAVIGWQSLAFPSLCRGGLHYPELVALKQHTNGDNDCSFDPSSGSEELAGRLQLLLADGRPPLVSAVEVDLSHADGASPLFQSDFQQWLAEFMDVPVKALAASDHEREQYLAAAVEVSSSRAIRSGAGRLILASDMVPTISVLVGGSDSPESDSRLTASSFIVAGAEHSQPATLIHAPAAHWSGIAAGLPRSFPSLETSGWSDVAAIRMASKRPLHEAELLVPVAAPSLEILPSTTAITWLVWPGAWPEADIIQSLEALSAQSHAGQSSIAFVGAASPRTQAIAEDLFGGRVNSFQALDEAASAIETPLAAYIGPGVILHDSRTAAHLSTLLEDPANATASVVLITIGKHGKGWVAATADAGVIPTLPPTARAPAAQSQDAMLLWRATWPGVRPPRDLWMTRTAALAGWLSVDSTGDAAGLHLCSSQVTASYCSTPKEEPAPVAPPANASDCAIRMELLVG